MININSLNQNNPYQLGKPQIKTQFSSLQLGENILTSGNMGKLIPIYVKELQPNQAINAKQAINIQFMPTVTNLIHQINGEIITYFVPYRLIWNDWETFVTGGKTGLEEPIMPYISFQSVLNARFNARSPFVNNPKYIKAITEVENMVEKYKTDSSPVIKRYAQILENTLSAIDNFISTGMESNTPLFDLNTYPNELKNLVDRFIKTTEPDFENYPLHFMFRSYGTLVKLLFENTLWDYLGLPYNMEMFIIWLCSITTEKAVYFNSLEGMENSIETQISQLPFRAYKKIYNDWIRLADWENEIEIDDRQEANDINILDGNYDWDYFTRARRYQLRGAMPTIPVTDHSIYAFKDRDDGTIKGINLRAESTGTTGIDSVKLYVDNQHASSGTVELMREIIDGATNVLDFQIDKVITAAALMNYYMANAKIRPRYAEHLLNRWNVRIQDARLQLAEFVGAHSINISSQGVVQTSEGTETKQGHITGQTWGNANNMSIQTVAQEHGILISLLLIKPSNMYELGYNAMLKRRNKFELAIPEFANLPDTAIYGDELVPTKTKKTEIIGYKSIYDEYRTTVNYVTGLLRPSLINGLKSYTLARKLNDITIDHITKCTPETQRVKQFTEGPDFILAVSTTTHTAIPLPFTSNVTVNI